MKRGDVLTVALSGDQGKPRPAVVVQSDLIADCDTVLVCPFTTVMRDASAHRLSVIPGPANGLRQPSQIMLDKISPARKTRCGPVIGDLDVQTMAELDRRLAFVIGLGAG